MEENRIVLLDEEGVEQEFELVISFDVEDKRYVLLAEDEESDDVFPFEVIVDEQGMETLRPVEDEAEFALIEEAYDALVDEDEDDV